MKMRAKSIAGVIALLSITLSPNGAGAQARVLEYRELDGLTQALSILPPGQGRHPSTLQFLQSFSGGSMPHNGNQRGMYDSLVRAAPTLAPSQLTTYFKDASFGIAPGKISRTYAPPLNPEVTIQRDSGFDVPRVHATSRSDVFYGAGYVAAEDRLFVMDVVRHLARGKLSELLGASESNLALDRAQRAVVDYSEAELEAMARRLVELDPIVGAQALQDIEDYAAGINAYIVEALANPTKLPGEYPVLQLVPKPWLVTDSIALTTLVGGMFSPGGAGQLDNARFLSALEAAGHNAADAKEIFDDFGFAEEPEAPTTTDDTYPLNADLGPVDPEAVAIPDPGSLVAPVSSIPDAADGPFGPIRLWNRGSGMASNALLVSAQLSQSGKPLAVMGPQISYWTPEVVMEIELHGPGVHARGVSLPGMGTAVLLGRGTSYAWSLTTAIADQADIRAVRLCEPSGEPATLGSTSYLDDGTCTPMLVRDDIYLAKPSAGGLSADVLRNWPVQRTRHGPVVARGTVEQEPVAFVRQRASYMQESDILLSYVELQDPARIADIADLQHAFRWYSLAFNLFLVAGDEIGFVTGGRYPLLADGVDPDLPFWGDSRWDWEGLLPYSDHPRDREPEKGYIVNWNNKQAPGFRAADSYHSWGPIHRSQLLEDELLNAAADDGKVSLTELVRAMAIPATQDLRGEWIAPLALEIIGETAGSSRLDAALSLLSVWSSGGAHRRDLNADGRYDETAAVALMDALWSPMLEEIFKPELGSAFTSVNTIQDNAPGPIGSAYATGWYGHAYKDLSAALGEPGIKPFSRQYCGGGLLSACRSALVRALDRAVASLEARFGASPSTWQANETADQLRFSSVGLLGQSPINWQNRPTFQHVLEF